MNYTELEFLEPVEAEEYLKDSNYIIESIEEIIKTVIRNGENKIHINTNLKKGLPMENINKIAGPFIEAWAQEKFLQVLVTPNNQYNLINVEECERLGMADIILQFKRMDKSGLNSSAITGNLDVKATSEDIPNSGKSPNITSFKRIRGAYIEDPDYIFVILSIKHKVYSERNEFTGLLSGIMEIVNFNVYDLKLISSSDISYNPSLGTGQIQIKNIHYVNRSNRTTWEFCKLLDKKFINSKKGFDEWLRLAIDGGWVKVNSDIIDYFHGREELNQNTEWQRLAKKEGWI